MNTFKYILSIALAGLVLSSCESKINEPWHWTPPEEDDNKNENVQTNLKPRYIWIDAAANFHDYANSKDNMITDCQKIFEMGFTDIVVDVRPTTGDVLFKTTYANQVTALASWSGGAYHLEKRTADWDYLEAFIEAGHKAGLKVHAAINTFVGGISYPYGLGDHGALFSDGSKKDWATVANTANGLLNVMDIKDGSVNTKFLNPSNPAVSTFLITILKDLAAYKELDGIFLDRCRYDDFTCDFSSYSRTAFEKYIGEKVENYPSDIMAPSSDKSKIQDTKWQKKWMEFRAKTIHDFVESASSAVHQVNPDIQFGTYVGGWYSSYYDVGVNWASPRFNTSASYSWATNDYMKYGYADHLDFILIGAYASASGIYGTTEWTCEGFCRRAGNVLMGDTKYAGGPDIGNWNTDGCSDVPGAVTNTVDACINASDGYFCFDLIHVKNSNYWDALKSGIDKYIKANSKTK